MNLFKDPPPPGGGGYTLLTSQMVKLMFFAIFSPAARCYGPVFGVYRSGTFQTFFLELKLKDSDFIFEQKLILDSLMICDEI